MQRVWKAVLVIALLVAGTATVSAHAYVERSDPREGETLQDPLREIRVWFTEALEPAMSRLTLLGPDGLPVAGAQPVALGSSALGLAVPDLPGGRYTVQWKVLSKDGHVTEGTISFQVKGTAAPQPAPAPAPAPAPVAPSAEPVQSQPAPAAEPSGPAAATPPPTELEARAEEGRPTPWVWPLLGAGLLAVVGIGLRFRGGRAS